MDDKQSNESTASLRELLEQLEQIVAWFNSSDLDVEAVTAKFAEGQKLATQIRDKLAREQTKIELVKHDFTRSAVTSKSDETDA